MQNNEGGDPALFWSDVLKKMPMAHAELMIGVLSTQTLGSCPTVLQAAEDSLMASYTIQPAIIATLKNFTAVSMYACYSANSYYDRAWRAPNKANLAVSIPSLHLVSQCGPHLPNRHCCPPLRWPDCCHSRT